PWAAPSRHCPTRPPAMYKHILVSISNPRDAQPAVQTALGLAMQSEATIELVGVGRHTRQAVAQFAHDATAESPFPVAVAFPDPPYAFALEQLIRSHGIDLVVISAREASARQGPLSSRTQAVIGAAPVPVLFIPGPGRPWRKLPHPVFRRVVVTLDGSSLAESVIPHALRLDQPADFEITLLTVAPLGQDGDEPYLERAADELRGRGARVHTHVAHDEHAAGGIVLYAYMNNMDLIAMSTHGRGGLSRILLGSVAERVMRLTALPVLLWRPGGAEALAGTPTGTAA
ncbi:MAG: universal stress protein, partial [Gemmatimonadaceae bacterium]